MYDSRRMKPWEKRGGRKTLPKMGWISPLAIVEDYFRPHPVTPTTVVIPCPCDPEETWDHYVDLVECAFAIIREHHLAKINHGGTTNGVAITFRTKDDAVKFILLFDGTLSHAN